ncbi:MAG: sigma-54 dependent transcriptional regulator [bacterium]
MSHIEKTVLVVDDSPDTLELLRRNLEMKGYRVSQAASVTEALSVLRRKKINLVITDYKMPDMDGFTLIKKIRSEYPEMEVIMVTGYGSIKGAVDAVKAGAEEYITKPFTDSELLEAVDRVFEKLKKRMLENGHSNKNVLSEYGMIGKSRPMLKVFRMIKKAAETSATVLISGESGTGKELAARAVHYNSRRSSAHFVPVNCGGVPENLLESELFGYVKGAFTGASETRAGFFQTAENGTIFLDEISEASLGMQVKLLRVLQNGDVCMLGDNRTRKVDIRIIAATNKNLEQLVKTGSFREDLFFRLNIISIDIPPLRKRGDDIFLLINHFTEKYSKSLGMEKPHFTDRALDAFRSYSWPGNVRELENCIQRHVVMNEGCEVDVTDLPEYMRYAIPAKVSVDCSLEEVEVEHIKRVLNAAGHNKTRAARILGIDRKTLSRKLSVFSSVGQ